MNNISELISQEMAVAGIAAAYKNKLAGIPTTKASLIHFNFLEDTHDF